MPTEEIKLGSGATAEKGKTIVIHYNGYLSRGDKFRSSYDEKEPVTFQVGRRRMIAGLERGVLGMKVGGVRRIRVSPHLAYGKKGIPGVVPPDAVLIFEVELLSVSEGG